MSKLEHDEIRREVRKQYGKVAVSEVSGCGCNKTSRCDAGAGADLEDYSAALGYSKEDIALVPEGANMGLGCGNPQAIASLKKGETVLDLGSGGGFDCFLAARQVEAQLGPQHRRGWRERGATGAAGLREHHHAGGADQHRDGHEQGDDPADRARTCGLGRRHRCDPGRERHDPRS